MLWNHEGVCVFTNGKVSVDEVGGSLQNILETEGSTTGTANKNEPIYKGGSGSSSGWGRWRDGLEERSSARLFSRHGTRCGRERSKDGQGKKKKKRKQSRAVEVFKHSGQARTLTRIKWRRNRVSSIKVIVCGAFSSKLGAEKRPLERWACGVRENSDEVPTQYEKSSRPIAIVSNTLRKQRMYCSFE